MRKILGLAIIISLSVLTACGDKHDKSKKDKHHKGKHKMNKANVIEIATFNLAEGVTPEEFAVLDKAVENEHVAKQPGFVARKTAYNAEEREWLVTVYWESLADADASMNSFANAPAAANFMQGMNPKHDADEALYICEIKDDVVLMWHNLM